MTDWREAIDAHIDAIADDLRTARRHLHVNPEPSREEFATTEYLAQRLAEAGIPYRVVPSGRGIIAGPPGCDGAPRVALRADMDALRIQDRKQVAYRSTRDGVMHACGHDAHSTMLLGAARALTLSQGALPWPVGWRAIFQPAEEVGEGAREMVSAGAVDGIYAIVALHVAPELAVGRVAVRRGVMTACCQEFDVAITGVGGHAARPHLCRDPIAAAAAFISTVYQTIPRSFDSREPVVVSIGAISGGTSANVIPDRVALRGTIRTLGRASAATVRERLSQIAGATGESTRTEFEVAFGHETDAVVNDTRVSEICMQAAREVVGAAQVEEIPMPSMGGEDFSGYLERAPGCLLRLGVAGNDAWPALHSPQFDIDERALAIGAKVLAHCAVLLAR